MILDRISDTRLLSAYAESGCISAKAEHKMKSLAAISLVFGILSAHPIVAADADQPAGVQGVEITRVSIRPTEAPITISARVLRSDPGRSQHALMQIVAGPDVQLELLLAVDQVSKKFMPASQVATEDATMWVWGTSAGLHAAAGYLATGRESSVDLAALPLGTTEFSTILDENGGSHEAVILIDMGESIVLLLYAPEGLVGARYASVDPSKDPAELIHLGLNLIAQQQAGKFNVVAEVGVGETGRRQTMQAPPTATCCPINCTTCCCTGSDGCASGPLCSDCGTMECKCQGAGPNCFCRPSAPGDQCLNVM